MTLDLDIIANWASIVGLVVSLYTLYKVSTIQGALRKSSRDRILRELFDEFVKQANAPTLAGPAVQQLDLILRTIRTHYISRTPLLNSSLKRHARAIDREMAGGKSREVIALHIRLMRTELSLD